MATETSASDKEEKKKLRGDKKGGPIDTQEIERRVHLAELRAREVEAEVRYLVAAEKRRSMKAEKREKRKKSGKTKGKGTKGAKDAGD